VLLRYRILTLFLLHACSTVRLKDRPARPGSFRRSSVASICSSGSFCSKAEVAIPDRDSSDGNEGSATKRYHRGSVFSLGSSGKSLSSFVSHDSKASQPSAGNPGIARRYERNSLLAMAGSQSSKSWTGLIEEQQACSMSSSSGLESGASGRTQGQQGIVRRSAARRLSAPPSVSELTEADLGNAGAGHAAAFNSDQQ
jgi:hypothetical protein